MFKTLPNIPEPHYSIIYIDDNPGTHDCDRNIAEDKRWVFGDTPLGSYTRLEKLNMHFFNYKPNKRERYDKE